MRVLILSLLTFFTITAHAHANDLDMSAFKTIPVLHEGRIKPLDTFARLHLTKLSGSEKNATNWLAQTLFDPAEAAEEKIFLLRDKNLKAKLTLPENENLFSFTIIQEALQSQADQIAILITKEPSALSPQQNTLLELQSNILTFAEIMRSLSLILPLNIEIPDIYKNDIIASNPSYLDLLPHSNKIQADVKNLAQQKGQDLSQYSEDQTKQAQLSLSLSLFNLAGENNKLLRIMPAQWNDKTHEWLAPWQTILSGQGSPKTKKYLDIWRDMASAYRSANKDEWSAATTQAQQTISDKTSILKLKLETIYNHAKPFHAALVLYTFGLIAIILSFRITKPFLKNTALITLSIATTAHMLGVAARIFLLDRPPVGTLYESVIFVALICATLGLIIFWRTKNFAALFAGTLSAILMLTIAPALIVNGENMEMLVAVLNTNFWLSTHVLCITSGYALSIFTACLAHAYLWARCKKKSAKTLKTLKSFTYQSSIAALLLTAVGTALGGIWADQSWGRFWGWDPKENGALLIVLWLVWLQHGRLAGKLRDVAFAAGTAFLNVIVALAWFGVNLLSVGLHSYGFIDGIAYSLGGFFILETVVIAALWFMIRTKENIS